MKKGSLYAILVLTLMAVICTSTGVPAKNLDAGADIIGAGATFPASLYQRWIQKFSETNPGFTLSYAAVGSGEGTSRFMAGKVDFGASDSAMSDDQMAKVPEGVQLIPATAGIVVLAYNLPGTSGQLRLSRDLYLDIFLGKIRRWNDPRIVALNPDLKLPDLNIVTVTRNDESGTTWAFTNHLNAVGKQWQQAGFSVAKKIDWPGNSMAVNYNEGVAVKIKHSWGAIGYMHYGTAKLAGLTMAALENKAGEFIAPSGESGTIALANNSEAMPHNLRMFLPDPSGKDSYPIVTYSWLLLRRSYPEKQKTERLKQFIEWGLTKGQSLAGDFGYTPLPDTVAATSLKALASVQ